MIDSDTDSRSSSSFFLSPESDFEDDGDNFGLGGDLGGKTKGGNNDNNDDDDVVFLGTQQQLQTQAQSPAPNTGMQEQRSRQRRTPQQQSKTQTQQQRQQQQQQQTQQQQQKQQPPMKKRKVSLSPTDSLAKQKPRSFLRESEEEGGGSHPRSPPRQSHPPAGLAEGSSKPTTTAAGTSAVALSPSLWKAAKKQQKDHIAATREEKQRKMQQRDARVDGTRESNPSGTAAEARGAKDSVLARPSESVPPKKRAPPGAAKARAKPTAKPKAETKAEPATQKTKPTKQTPQTLKPKKKAKPSGKPETVAPGPTQEPPAAAPGAAPPAPTKPSEKPRKKKATPKKKRARTTFEDDLLKAMFLGCRPYSLRDLTKLAGTTTQAASEASVNFCLLSHVDKAWVTKKVFGSSKTGRTKELYWANQACTDPALWAKPGLKPPSREAVQDARLELAALQKTLASVRQQTETLEKTPSGAELRARCEAAEEEAERLRAELRAVKDRIAAGTHQPAAGRLGRPAAVPRGRPKTPRELKQRINKMRTEWKKRKRSCMDFVDQLADGLEKKVGDVVHKVLELETDEAEGAVMPPPHPL